jgi:hypothetical protein
MEKLKIIVNDDQESLEVQGLLESIGYRKIHHWGNYKSPKKIMTNEDWYSDYTIDSDEYKSRKIITLPQLRDLVVLKRNDVKDANYRSTKVSDGHYFKSSDGKFYFMFEGCWVVSEIDTDEGLEPITKAQGLISGAEAMTHAINGEYVEFFAKGGTGKWNNFNDEDWSVDDLKSPCYQFRLKPPTLTVNAELPKPSNTTFHNQNYSVTYEFGSREERNAFVEGLGGNNS